MFSLSARQWSLRPYSHRLTIAVIALSIIQALLTNSGIELLAFKPISTVSNLEVWRPLTALLIASSPMEVIFGGLILYSIGGALEGRVGRQRFLIIALALPLIAELITLPIFFLFPTLPDLSYPGARNSVTSIWIAFGLIAALSGRTLNFWGNPISGKMFAFLGLGFVLLTGVFGGFILVLPEILSAALTYGYILRRDPFDLRRRTELLYYNWKLRRLKARKGFRVVRGSKDDDDPSKQNIH